MLVSKYLITSWRSKFIKFRSDKYYLDHIVQALAWNELAEMYTPCEFYVQAAGEGKWMRERAGMELTRRLNAFAEGDPYAVYVFGSIGAHASMLKCLSISFNDWQQKGF